MSPVHRTAIPSFPHAEAVETGRWSTKNSTVPPYASAEAREMPASLDEIARADGGAHAR